MTRSGALCVADIQRPKMGNGSRAGSTETRSECLPPTRKSRCQRSRSHRQYHPPVRRSSTLCWIFRQPVLEGNQHVWVVDARSSIQCKPQARVQRFEAEFLHDGASHDPTLRHHSVDLIHDSGNQASIDMDHARRGCWSCGRHHCRRRGRGG